MENFIKYDFQMEQDGMTYTDAIVLPVDHSYTPEEIEAMKVERFNNWLYVTTNPAPMVTSDTYRPTPVQDPSDINQNAKVAD